MLHGIAQAVSWLALVSAIPTIVIGAVTLVRRRAALPWLQRRPVRWKPWGWALITLGLFTLLETVPRLAGFSAGWTFVLSCLAILLLPVGFWLQGRAQPSRA
jgi:hypothetical protein